MQTSFTHFHMIANQNKRKTIESQKPSIKTAFFFWLIVVVIPFLLGKMILSIYVEHAFLSVKKTSSNLLKEDILKFSHFVKIESYVTCMIMEMEQELNLPSLIENDFSKGKVNYKKNDFFDSEFLSGKIRKLFKLKTGAKPLFVFVFDKNKKKVSRWLDPARKKWARLPGNAAAMILMESLYAQSLNENYLEPHVLFPRIVETLFGAYFERPLRNRRLKSVFSTKLGGKRLFVYCNFFPKGAIQNDSSNGYLIAFTEDTIPSGKHLEWSKNYETPDSVKRKIGFAKSSFTMKTHFSDQGLLSVYLPFPPKAFRVGSHGQKSLVERNLKNGKLLERPAKSLFLACEISLADERKSLERKASWLNLAFFLANFFSLFLLKQLCMDGKLNLKIHSKLFLVILAATIIPLAGFFVVATRYFDFFQDLMISNHQASIVQELQLLELSIRNNEVACRTELEKYKERINQIVSAEPEKISKALDEQIGVLHDGYSFIRSDGLVLERGPSGKDIFPKEQQKLIFYGNLFKGMATRIFTVLNLCDEKTVEKFERIPGGKTILAMGKLFVETDLDCFFLQAGEVFQTEKSEHGNYRLITYNLLPDNQGKIKHWAFVSFLQSAKRITSDFLRKQTDNWRFFLHRDNGVLTTTGVFPVEQEDDMLTIQGAWPANLKNDMDFERAARKLRAGKSNDSWITYSKEGFPTIFAARKVYKMPFVVVSKAVLAMETGNKSLLNAVMLVLLLYSVILISIITHSLTEVFINPLKTLFRATALVNIGEYPRIEYKSELELAKVVQKFNHMTTGLQERQKLERFVSAEATRTVVNESLDLKERAGEKMDATILFTHIRDFDLLCENISAEEIIESLNHYFAQMEPIIQRNHGVIDKYIGDAIMVVFTRKDNEKEYCRSDACLAALQMLGAQKSLSEKLLQKHLPPLTLGIGIAHGEVIRGKIGAQEGRKDFTVIGDVVNFAARLESISHQKTDAAIMVSEDLFRACSSEFFFADCGEIFIKGKKDKQAIFQLTGAKSGAGE